MVMLAKKQYLQFFILFLWISRYFKKEIIIALTIKL